MTIDSSWTLFLDRDGVINVEKRNDYVKTIDEFHFEERALEALSIFNGLFKTIVIVTNQRGVGANEMSVEDLDTIHNYMLTEIKNNGGRIDKIYAATDVDRSSINRKPHPTMGYNAKKDFSEIDFSKSIMVGNSISDMEFGKVLQMTTVFIDEKHKFDLIPQEKMDLIFNKLIDFALFLKSDNN